MVIASHGKAVFGFYDEHGKQLLQTVKDPSMQLSSLNASD